MTDDCLTLLEYETRNLEIPSYAISHDFLDTPDEACLTQALAGKLATHGKLFAQARVFMPGQTAAISMIERHRFSFVETTLAPTIVLGKNKIFHAFRDDPRPFVPRRFDPADLKLTFLDRTDADACEMLKQIAAESFVKDRFHTDPNCPPGLADRRFVFWVEDLLQSDAVFQLQRYRDEVIGFMARKDEHLILAGFSRKYAGSGLGDFLWLSVLASMHDDGMTQVDTQISTNNLPVLNLYVRLGFKFKDQTALFHFWSTP